MRPIPLVLQAPLRELYSARDKLRKEFPELSFALDGNLIGHIGEAIAIDVFKLKKLPAGSKTHDFKTTNGNFVQVKTTQVETGSVGLGQVKTSFQHLLVLRLVEPKFFEILYDGPGTLVDEARSHKESPSLSVRQLRALNEKVEVRQRLAPI